MNLLDHECNCRWAFCCSLPSPLFPAPEASCCHPQTPLPSSTPENIAGSMETRSPKLLRRCCCYFAFCFCFCFSTGLTQKTTAWELAPAPKEGRRAGHPSLPSAWPEPSDWNPSPAHKSTPGALPSLSQPGGGSPKRLGVWGRLIGVRFRIGRAQAWTVQLMLFPVNE